MEIKTMVVKSHLNDGLPAGMTLSVGWGNGYVGVPPDHPWYYKDAESLDVVIHGGLTYAGPNAPYCQPDGYWWVGFDTAHYMDSPNTCPKSYVEDQTNALYQQAYAVYDPPAVHTDTDHRELDIDL